MKKTMRLQKLMKPMEKWRQKTIISSVVLLFSALTFAQTTGQQEEQTQQPPPESVSKEIYQNQKDTTSGDKTEALDEIVVTGYSSQKKQSITGAVAQLNVSDMAKTKVADVGQALQGQVAGVFVAANTGAPGDGLKIRIRGEGTIRTADGTAGNDVLYVIDGVPTRDISSLNMSDVKSMTVLKDAAASAIYGSRAAGGVIVITTKSGVKGKAKIDVEYYSGWSNATNLPTMLNADQYLTVKDQAWHNTKNNEASASSPYAIDRATGSVNDIALSNTNWLDELFTQGRTNNFQLSVSGGNDKTTYLISGGYFGQDGIVIDNNDSFQRLNFRTNLNSDITERLKVGTNIQMTNAIQDKLSSSGDEPGVIRHALLRPPVLSVYKSVSDPTYNPKDPYTDLPFYVDNKTWSSNYEKTSNPIAIVNYTDDVRTTFKTFGNVYGEYSFLSEKELKFRSSLGAEIIFDHNKNFGENYGDDDGSDQYPGMGRQNRPSNLNEDRGGESTITFTNTLNYNKTFAEIHDVNILLGEESIVNEKSGVGGSRTNYNRTDDPFRYLDYGSDLLKHSSGTFSSWKLLSFFGSGSYGFDRKYYVYGTLRADGSSRFGPNNKWGYFPSVSGSWIMSNESFMENVSWISNLKWRVSWGQSGNQEIPDNAYQSLVSETEGVININRYGNPDLKWETTTQTNFGLDLSIINNKLTFSADYFNKTTDDILLSVTLPSVSVGVIDKTYVNAGIVKNSGFELGLNYQNTDNAFKYGINGNIATLINKVEALQQYVTEIYDEKTNTKTVVGQPINSYYGYQFDGIYQNPQEITSHLFANENGAMPGDMKFKDLNNDGQINADDRTFIGSSIPKVTYGASFNASYMRFDISCLFQGVSGVDRFSDLTKILNYDSRPFNSTTAVLDAWNGEGTSNTTPRNTFNDNGGSKFSSAFVEDASYLRLKSLEIGYNFNPEIIGNTDLRIYVSGQNLWTLTNYTGLDPESTSLVDMGTYPQSKTLLLGLKFKI